MFILYILFCSDLKRMAPKTPHKAELLLLGKFDDDKSYGGIIEDPYYVRGFYPF